MNRETSVADLVASIRDLTSETQAACQEARWDEATELARKRHQLLEVLFTRDLTGYQQVLRELAEVIEQTDSDAAARVQAAKKALAGQLGHISLGRKARDAYEGVQSQPTRS
jgi:hypothetical protein